MRIPKAGDNLEYLNNISEIDTKEIIAKKVGIIKKVFTNSLIEVQIDSDSPLYLLVKNEEVIEVRYCYQNFFGPETRESWDTVVVHGHEDIILFDVKNCKSWGIATR